MAGFFDTLVGGGAEKEAAEKNRALYNDYLAKGTGYIDTGYNTARGDLGNALDAFTPLSQLGQKYGAGTSLYLDSLGVNGPAGNDRAVAAFQAGPGYNYLVDQTLDNANRAASAGGMLNSGNTLAALQDRAKNLADQSYGQWQSGLAGLISPELSATSGAASGQAGVYGGLAGLATQNASDKTNLLGNTTSGLVGANTLQAQGEASGAKNLLGLGTSLASLAMGGLGGGGLSLGSWGLGGGGPITYGGPNGPTAFYRG
ncbi:MAG: hypothetical protein J0H75_00750 [Rhizobiales bacterium]|nr:hypothetical protein [Hyphomicrobiales bacterium]